MHTIIIRTTVLAILLTFAGPADADNSMRCKGRIVGVGDTAAKVLSLCGDPASRISTTVPVRAGNLNGFARFSGFATSEQWVYDRGYGKFPAVLFFDHGMIRRVDFLEHRSGD